METLWLTLRYTLRVLAKNPGFTIVAVLSLALGIGANTAIFTLINALLLRDLTVRQPARSSGSPFFHPPGSAISQPAAHPPSTPSSPSAPIEYRASA